MMKGLKRTDCCLASEGGRQGEGWIKSPDGSKDKPDWHSQQNNPPQILMLSPKELTRISDWWGKNALGQES